MLGTGSVTAGHSKTGDLLILWGLVLFTLNISNEDTGMKELIELYIMKIKTGYITDTEIDRYDALIELYITSMKTRLERRIKNGY